MDIIIDKWEEILQHVKEEFELIQKFKQSRIRTREAYEHLKELLCCYQEEYESNSRKIKEIKEKKK